MKRCFRENEPVTVRYAFSERDGEIAGPPSLCVPWDGSPSSHAYPVLFDDGSADPSVSESSIRPRGQLEMVA